jgi:hypothetical protein
MTEQEWLKGSKPEALLQFLARKRARGLLRKLRLFSCAICRQLEPSLPVRAIELVSTVEDLSDREGATWTPIPTGLQDDQGKKFDFPDESKRHAMLTGTYRAGEKIGAAARALGSLQFMLLRTKTKHAAFQATLGLREAVVAITGKRSQQTGYQGWKPHLTARWDKQGDKVRAAFAHLLRHIIGNPFHPHPAPSSWPSAVVQLAESQYAGQDCSFALHDALLEAGHAELAEHFQEEKLHPKGCWVVDLILGKE